jgi:hypothetical protein
MSTDIVAFRYFKLDRRYTLKLNFDFEDSVVNVDIPFLALEPKAVAGTKPPLIDAIYIPTQEHRPILFTNIDILKKHAKHIYLLFSNNNSKWADELDSDKISVIRNFNSCFDIKQYNSHATSKNPSILINPNYDIPAKRTFSLEHAKIKNFNCIGFLDDDIQLTSKDLLRVRIALSTSAHMVSFHVLSFPDVSTVDHIERILMKKASRVSIGGNCLFLRPENCTGYFPFIYNDDWFFIFKNMPNNNIYSLGTARQRPYRPWASTNRIRFEQFGDIIIEGVKSNIASGSYPFLTNVEFWGDQLKRYLIRLERMLSIAPDCILKERLNDALKMSLSFKPSQLHAFVSSYRLSETWRKS